MEKRGQIGVFIIIGLVVVIVAGLLIYAGSLSTEKKLGSQTQEKQRISQGMEAIHSYIQNCVEQTSKEGLYALGARGGYVDIPLLLIVEDTVYWNYESVNVQPFLSDIKTSLDDYLKQNLQKCSSFALFEEQGFNISTQKPSADVVFGESDVRIRVQYPVKLTNQGVVKEFLEFQTIQPIRFRQMYEIATLVNNEMLKPGFNKTAPMPGSDILNITYEDVPDGILMSIKEKETSKYESGLVFRFGAKLATSDLVRRVNLPENSATIPLIESFNLTSPDWAANVEFREDTTISKNGKDIKELTAEIIQKTQFPDPGMPYASEIYEFKPEGARFNKPAVLTIYYQKNSSPYQNGRAIPFMFMFDKPRNQWVFLDSKHDAEAGKVIIEIQHFSDYAVFWTVCGDDGNADDCAKQKGGGCIKFDMPVEECGNADITRTCPAGLKCLCKGLYFDATGAAPRCISWRCSLPDDELYKRGCNECSEKKTIPFLNMKPDQVITLCANRGCEQKYPCSEGRNCRMSKMVLTNLFITMPVDTWWRCG